MKLRVLPEFFRGLHSGRIFTAALPLNLPQPEDRWGSSLYTGNGVDKWGAPCAFFLTQVPTPEGFRVRRRLFY